MTESPLQAEPAQSADTKKRNKIPTTAIVFIVIAGMLLLSMALDTIFRSTDHQEHDNITVSSPSTKDQAPSHAAPAAQLPPLSFTSSGRLPTDFHGLQLGTPVDQALAQYPDLKSCLGDASIPCTLGGFPLSPVFFKGRLVMIDSDIEDMRPEDAALFNANTLNQLGRPNFNVYEGPSTDAWVWIDGDIRIRYTNSGTYLGRSGPRSVNMEMVVYPAMMAMILTDKNSKNPALQAEGLLLEKGWNQSPLDLKILPRSLFGVALLMAPWQVRSALPGIEIDTVSEDEATGELKTARDDTSVSFWDGRAMAISKTWYDVSDDQITQIRAKSLKDYGTPVMWLPQIALGTEAIAWNDNETNILLYLGLKGENAQKEIYACFTDRRLASLRGAAEAAANPPKFEAAPATHSFF